MKNNEKKITVGVDNQLSTIIPIANAKKRKLGTAHNIRQDLYRVTLLDGELKWATVEVEAADDIYLMSIDTSEPGSKEKEMDVILARRNEIGKMVQIPFDEEEAEGEEEERISQTG